MSPCLENVLKKLLTQRKKEALQSGSGEIVPFVFHKDGKLLDEKLVRRVLKRVQMKAGLRLISPKALRHTYASILLSSGVSPFYVKEQMGHSSIQITIDVYGHLIPNLDKGAMKVLDSIDPHAPYTHPDRKENLKKFDFTVKIKTGAEEGID